MEAELILTIKNRIKAIPYIPERRGDGTVNYGFRVLKGRLDQVSAIPEVHDSEALQYALEKINAEATAFFTVGCEKDLNAAPEGFWARGYIEFAFNASIAASDADRYFRLFFEFNQHLQHARLNLPVQYQFELEGAEFRDAGDAGSRGFTVAVWITTLSFPDGAQAMNIWNRAVVCLADFLSCFERGPMPALYGPALS